MSNFIYVQNVVNDRIENYFEDFKKEALVVYKAKCLLLNGEEPGDFNIKGIDVSVNKKGNNYVLYYDDQCLKILVENRMISDLE